MLTAAIDQVRSDLGPYDWPLTAELALRVAPQGFTIANGSHKFVFGTLPELEQFRDRIAEIIAP